MLKSRCSAMVYPNDRWGSFHGHQCKFNAVVSGDGKSYCRIHDPMKRAAKHEERQNKWDKERARMREDSRRQRAMVQACQDVSTKILETIKVKDLIAMTSPIPGCEGDETK